MSRIIICCPNCQIDITDEISINRSFYLDNGTQSDTHDYRCRECNVPLVLTISIKVDVTTLATENAKILNKLLKDLEQVK